MQVIEANKVSFDYNGTQALSQVSFSVGEGDFLGIVGGNGTGKSTLLKLITGVLPLQSGRLTLFGVDVADFNDYSRISYIAQTASHLNGSFPTTVFEMVLSGLAGKTGLFRPYQKQHKEMAFKCLQAVGMADYRKRLIGTLSGGQLQRALIARALVSSPELMLLDEPTVGIDNQSVESICCLLARLNREQSITMVMVSHDLSSVLAHARNLLVCSEDGRVRMVENSGSLAQLNALISGKSHQGGRH